MGSPIYSHFDNPVQDYSPKEKSRQTKIWLQFATEVRNRGAHVSEFATEVRTSRRKYTPHDHFTMGRRVQKLLASAKL
eukprot:scaffold14167_cov107-Amphora_coffeaeformis.AAC.1